MKILILASLVCTSLSAAATLPWMFAASVSGDDSTPSSTFFLDVIDWSTGRTHASIPVTVNPGLYSLLQNTFDAIAIHPDGKIAYVLEDLYSNGVIERQVKVVCLLSSKVIARIFIGLPEPFDWDSSDSQQVYSGRQIAVTPDGKYIYVAKNDPAANIFVVCTATNQVIAKIALNSTYRWPQLWVTPDSKYLYTNMNGVVFGIATATNKVIARIDTGVYGFGADVDIPHPHSVMTHDGAFLYVSDPISCRISVISTWKNEITDVIPVADPVAIALTPDGESIWVSTNSFLWTSRAPGQYALTPTGDPKISVIDTSTNNVVDTFPDPAIAVAGDLYVSDDIAFTPDGKLAYFITGRAPSNGGAPDFKIHVLDTQTKQLVEDLPLPAGGYAIGLLAPR